MASAVGHELGGFVLVAGVALGLGTHSSWAQGRTTSSTALSKSAASCSDMCSRARVDVEWNCST
jgi:hypothetical protein